MFRNTLRLISALILLALSPMWGLVHADDFIQSDIKTTQDHPLLKRFEGSVLIAGDKRTFDEFNFALGRVEFDYATQAIKPWNKLKAEGAHHTAYYRMPKDVTTLEAMRNYENDLTAKGFEVLFKGSKEELDNGYGRFIAEVYNHPKGNHLMEYVLPGAGDYRYLAAKKKNENGSEVYVSGFFALVSAGWDSKFAHVGDGLARIDVIETKPMDNRMVQVKAEEMQDQIQKMGRVALYGILFDFNKAEIKSESESTLAEIAKYLTTNPAVRVLVVGHTDNAGAFELNRDLSDKRAKSVVDYLVGHYKVARDRLFPFGVSFASPVATNETEEGRAKNRRVELVKY